MVGKVPWMLLQKRRYGQRAPGQGAPELNGLPKTHATTPASTMDSTDLATEVFHLSARRPLPSKAHTLNQCQQMKGQYYYPNFPEFSVDDLVLHPSHNASHYKGIHT
jgi:hypothetical protein